MSMTPADLQHKRERKADRRRGIREGRLRRNSSVTTENWHKATKTKGGWSAMELIGLGPLINRLANMGNRPRADKHRNRKGA